MILMASFVEDKLIFMDPHFCQDTIDIQDRNFPVHVSLPWIHWVHMNE